MHRANRSQVWDHFEELSSEFARCKEKDCNKILKRTNGGTSSLVNHLQFVHSLIQDKKEKEVEKKDGAKQDEMLDISVKEDQEESDLANVLMKSIEKATSSVKSSGTSFSSKQVLRKEVNLFEATGKLPESLHKLQQALLTIPPTSVEAEGVSLLLEILLQS